MDLASISKEHCEWTPFRRSWFLFYITGWKSSTSVREDVGARVSVEDGKVALGSSYLLKGNGMNEQHEQFVGAWNM